MHDVLKGNFKCTQHKSRSMAMVSKHIVGYRKSVISLVLYLMIHHLYFYTLLLLSSIFSSNIVFITVAKILCNLTH